ncbi:MAG: hypothetical protein KA753_11900, partial [Paludibacter sp.]|nr:hypothetical protein [Paludibacter sp.]
MRTVFQRLISSGEPTYRRQAEKQLKWAQSNTFFLFPSSIGEGVRQLLCCNPNIKSIIIVFYE